MVKVVDDLLNWFHCCSARYKKNHIYALVHYKHMNLRAVRPRRVRLYTGRVRVHVV